jgi:hypothetical protein
MGLTPVWCLLIDQENRPTESRSFFKVTAEDIAQLKDEVKRVKPKALQNIDTPHLVVWRYKDQSIALRKENWEDRVGKLFSDPGAEKIHEWTTLADLELLDNETLLVQVPGVFSPSSFNRAILISVVRNQWRA